jgi:hypothetical protein
MPCKHRFQARWLGASRAAFIPKDKALQDVEYFLRFQGVEGEGQRNFFGSRIAIRRTGFDASAASARGVWQYLQAIFRANYSKPLLS